MSRDLKWFSMYHAHKLSWARCVSKYYDICQLQFPLWVDRKKGYNQVAVQALLYSFPEDTIHKWQTNVHIGKQNGNTFN